MLIIYCYSYCILFATCLYSFVLKWLPISCYVFAVIHRSLDFLSINRIDFRLEWPNYSHSIIIGHDIVGCALVNGVRSMNLLNSFWWDSNDHYVMKSYYRVRNNKMWNLMKNGKLFKQNIQAKCFLTTRPILCLTSQKCSRQSCIIISLFPLQRNLALDMFPKIKRFFLNTNRLSI